MHCDGYVARSWWALPIFQPCPANVRVLLEANERDISQSLGQEFGQTDPRRTGTGMDDAKRSFCPAQLLFDPISMLVFAGPAVLVRKRFEVREGGELELFDLGRLRLRLLASKPWEWWRCHYQKRKLKSNFRNNLEQKKRRYIAPSLVWEFTMWLTTVDWLNCWRGSPFLPMFLYCTRTGRATNAKTNKWSDREFGKHCYNGVGDNAGVMQISGFLTSADEADTRTRQNRKDRHLVCKNASVFRDLTVSVAC